MRAYLVAIGLCVLAGAMYLTASLLADLSGHFTNTVTALNFMSFCMIIASVVIGASRWIFGL